MILRWTAAGVPKPSATSAKSPGIAHCQDWPPPFTLVSSRSTGHAELIIQSRQPK